MRILIVGCGYVGLPLGTELVKHGHEVFGVRRSDAGAGDLNAAGIRSVIADITRPEDLAKLPGPFDWVVNTVSSSKGGVDEYREVYLNGTRHLLDWLAPAPPQKFVYTSSTGVYGQTDGEVVKEDAPTRPESPTSQLLVETERLLLDAAQARKFPAVILRVAGIYGPDRGHFFLQYLRNEARLAGQGERLMNMIHRDDLVSVIIAALKSGRPGEIYNAVDDEPVAQIHFFRWLSETLGKGMPPFAAEEESDQRKRGLTNKRVSNRKLKMELGVQLKYPNFRQGYTAEITRLDRAGLLKPVSVQSPLMNDQLSANSPAAESPRRPRLVCFVNGIFADQIGGGDIYFAHMVQAALGAGYEIHCFGGHALKRYLEKWAFPMNLTLTDHGAAQLGDTNRLPGQFRLLFDFARRLMGTLRRLKEVQKEDITYAMSDYWFDTIPLMLCRSRAKILYLGMMAPTLRQVVFRERADVTASRLAALYYWLSQQFSLRFFRRCRGGLVTYSHPEMKDYLLRLGYRESHLGYVPNGSDVETAERVPDQPKQFDVVWTGRVHPQKGIDDLLATLARLKERLPDFRAVIIGKSKETLEPIVREMGLQENVTFSGMVTEQEKFRLLKASRVFAMPSRYESWGIVVGEALAAGVPVVAYELGCYRPVFGDFVRYVKPFDRLQWLQTVEREVLAMRAGRNYLGAMDLPALKKTLSWAAAQKAFCTVLAG